MYATEGYAELLRLYCMYVYISYTCIYVICILTGQWRRDEAAMLAYNREKTGED